MVQTWPTSNLMSFLSKILKNLKTHFRVKFGARVKIKLQIVFKTINFIYPENLCLSGLLQNSLGGNAKTAVICTVTPAAMSEDQTMLTLRFARQAKRIQNHAKVNEVLDDKAHMNKLVKEMADLKKILAEQQNRTASLAGVREELERQKLLNDKLRADSEARIKAMEKKLLVSSQPSPSRKSTLPQGFPKDRRETWCGPQIKRERESERRTMRASCVRSVFKAPPAPLDFKPHKYRPGLWKSTWTSFKRKFSEWTRSMTLGSKPETGTPSKKMKTSA